MLKLIFGRTIILLFSIVGFSMVWAKCPDYLNSDVRLLRSKETVNICKKFADKPLLIVNTASHCGYTPQFKGLEALYQEHKESGLQVIGFPSNSFNQEAKDEKETADVCYVNYGVTFTMLSTISVKGKDAHPIFAELAKQSKEPAWNFNKYLVDKDGNVVKHFGSKVKPDSKEIQTAIKALTSSK